MNADHQVPLTFHANQEHTGVRIAVLVVLAASFVAFFLGINILLSSQGGALASYSIVLSCLGALPITFGIGALVEYWLKKRWPSGQQIRLSEDGLEAILNDGDKVSVDWSARFNVLKWHFPLKGYARGGRERRVPSSYRCLAIQVQQDDDRLTVHGYMPAKDLEQLIEGKTYQEIKPSDYTEGGTLRRWQVPLIGRRSRPTS